MLQAVGLLTQKRYGLWLQIAVLKQFVSARHREKQNTFTVFDIRCFEKGCKKNVYIRVSFFVTFDVNEKTVFDIRRQIFDIRSSKKVLEGRQLHQRFVFLRRLMCKRVARVRKVTIPQE